jgi:large subunit ribosomal protein L9
MIRVILKEGVTGLGVIGEVKQVKDGYARNYLLPRRLALLATEHNLKKIETDQKKAEIRKVLEKKNAQDLAARLENLSVTIAVEVNDEGKLYGSLSASDIVNALAVEGVTIDKKNLMMESSIKELGIYDLGIRLHPEVSTKIKAWVVKK